MARAMACAMNSQHSLIRVTPGHSPPDTIHPAGTFKHVELRKKPAIFPGRGSGWHHEVRQPFAVTGVLVDMADVWQASAPQTGAVCNLVRNRHRHLRVVRLRTPRGHDEASSEHAVMLREDRRELLAALAALPPRRREAIVLRYWLDLSEREMAATMQVSAGTVKSLVSRGLDALSQALEGKI